MYRFIALVELEWIFDPRILDFNDRIEVRLLPLYETGKNKERRLAEVHFVGTREECWELSRIFDSMGRCPRYVGQYF